MYNRTTQSLKHFQIPHIHAMHPHHPTQPKHKIPNSQNILAIQHTKKKRRREEMKSEGKNKRKKERDEKKEIKGY